MTPQGFRGTGEEVRNSVLHKFRPRRQRWRVNGAVAIVAFDSGETETEIYDKRFSVVGGRKGFVSVAFLDRKSVV